MLMAGMGLTISVFDGITPIFSRVAYCPQFTTTASLSRWPFAFLACGACMPMMRDRSKA